MTKELLKQALDALTTAVNQNQHDMLMTGEECRASEEAIAALEAAIAQPVQPTQDIGSVYSIALQRAIESHCDGKFVPIEVSAICPYHSTKLDAKLTQPVQPEIESK